MYYYDREPPDGRVQTALRRYGTQSERKIFYSVNLFGTKEARPDPGAPSQGKAAGHRISDEFSYMVYGMHKAGNTDAVEIPI